MNKAYLLIGGNMGNREQNLANARLLIEEYCGHITHISSVYETAAWGVTDQPAFLNQAIEIETELNAKQLIRRILKTEKKMGRIRKQKMGPRNIDIDILFFDQAVYNYPFLNVPHPQLHNRRFALLPMAEIAPDFIHPVFEKNIMQLLDECPDTLAVNKL